MVLYAASRKGQDLGLTPASSKTMMRYPKLDIADRNSIDDFARTIQKDHTNVDVLINNAGTNLDMEYSPANVKTTLDTNYRGTLNTFIPMLRKNGRIVNVSSTGSSLGGYSKEIQDRFRNPEMTLPDLDQMMNEYQEAANSGTESQHGWKSQAYGVTKAAMNAMTAILARQNPGLIINACCPGWVYDALSWNPNVVLTRDTLVILIWEILWEDRQKHLPMGPRSQYVLDSGR
ncbi:MAG: hypothetical protein Q9209_003697 [Squamulea sp. 1 TL-2023]